MLISSCGSGKKFRFSSKADAKREVKAMVRKNKGFTARRVYFCEHCGYWHLTSQKPHRIPSHV